MLWILAVLTLQAQSLSKCKKCIDQGKKFCIRKPNVYDLGDCMEPSAFRWGQEGWLDTCSNDQRYTSKRASYSLWKSSILCGVSEIFIDNEYGMENPVSTQTLALNKNDLCNFEIVYHKFNRAKLAITQASGWNFYLIDTKEGMRSVEMQLFEQDSVERKLEVGGNYTLLVISNQNQSNWSFTVSPLHPSSSQPSRILIISLILS